MRRALPAMLLVLLAGCGPARIDRPPGRAALPAAAPEVGVAYRMTVYCPTAIEIGKTFWNWPPNGDYEWPPQEPQGTLFGIWDSVEAPHPVHGIFIASTEDIAAFRADVNGEEIPLVRVDPEHASGDGCM